MICRLFINKQKIWNLKNYFKFYSILKYLFAVITELNCLYKTLLALCFETTEKIENLPPTSHQLMYDTVDSILLGYALKEVFISYNYFSSLLFLKTSLFVSF